MFLKIGSDTIEKNIVGLNILWKDQKYIRTDEQIIQLKF